MDLEIQRLLEENNRLAQENHRLLKKLVRKGYWESAFRIMYVLVFLGVILVSYYYVQPYLESLQGLYFGDEEGGGLQEKLDLFGL